MQLALCGIINSALVHVPGCSEWVSLINSVQWHKIHVQKICNSPLKTFHAMLSKSCAKLKNTVAKCILNPYSVEQNEAY